MNALLRTEESPIITYEITGSKHSLSAEYEQIYRRQIKTVYRVCYGYMKNSADTEDVVADTFCKMISSKTKFESAIHEKAWLIRTASNICKNKLKHWSRNNVDIDEQINLETSDYIDDTLKIVLQLPEKFKTVIYLYYYEQYSSEEISAILKKPSSTIRNYLSEARKILKEQLGDNYEN
ncbi:hypothetical protein FACS1894132_01720 [Clostridia bacterium]|nr:hypothetical protein FACS1894132_01720 [Clostridia bacterium]